MQSGNGMTMQEAEQEIKYYQKIFQVVRLLKGEDVERTFYQQGKGTCENVQDGCPCYSFWKKNGKCDNCSSYKALREKKQMIKLEFLESEVYQVISRYMEIDGQPYVMELINHLEDDTLIDISCREKLINKLTGYNEKLYKDVLTGDMALAAVAGVIWRCIRREDTLVRYGGDEFVLVLPEIKEDGLVEKLQEIQEKIQNAVIPGYSNIQLSVSMGAVISQNESVEHAMLRARKLMYQAKNKKNMAITENNMIDHEGKIHAQKQPEKMIPEILVVDDEEVNRTLLDMIFSKDYHVLQAESGEKCIEILEQQVNSISLVLLDVVLPKMDGFDVLTYMNKNHWIEDIPVIMMSGADAPEAVKRAYALGAVDFVSKPCDAQIVYQRVTNTMKLYAKQRRLTSLITAQINEKEKNSEMLIHILSHIVEFRNGESGSHVLHIHKLTEMLLERLAQKTEKYHLDGDTRAMIALASSLHDIGKIGVDEKILNKPGKLTKEEFEIMKTHTVIGAEMLEQLGIYQDEPLVKIAHQICRWHHERYDGKGYPDGLVGDEIPISAQVVSVADVYDALASERVYKKAVPHEKVLEMILHGECGQFNPILIECLQEISSRIRSECYDEEQET